jgi:ABC-type lipoprotein export system ATPase subunit
MIQLRQRYQALPGGREALKRLTLQIDTGEMVFLTGRSGAGKSTLLKLIALIERPTRGQLLVDGVNTWTPHAGTHTGLPPPARGRVPGSQAAHRPHRVRQRRRCHW